MNHNDSQEKLIMFTVGHLNHRLDGFINLLKSQKVDVLVDVRSKPSSRFSHQINKEGLKKAVKAIINATVGYYTDEAPPDGTRTTARFDQRSASRLSKGACRASSRVCGI